MAVVNAVEHRQRVLHALGVTTYVLRARPGDARTPASATVPDAAACRCVLVLPEGATEDQQHFLDRVMQALGGDFAGARRVVVTAGELHGPVPEASAYLAFGEAQARALGRSLPAVTAAAAEVLLLDEPQALRGGDGKRRLWQAVRGLRRHWRDTAGAE